MRSLVIDDEESARARLHRLLSVHSEIQVVGEAHFACSRPGLARLPQAANPKVEICRGAPDLQPMTNDLGLTI